MIYFMWMPNAASARDFVVKAKSQREGRRCTCRR